MPAVLGAALLALLALAAPPRAFAADEEPTFRIVFRNGAIEPRRLEVPARTRFRLELVNENDAPAEFESAELHKERALAPHSQTVMVIRTLEPGEYAFFDDFRPGSEPAILVAK